METLVITYRAQPDTTKVLKALRHSGKMTISLVTLYRLREGDGLAAWLGGLTLHHSRDGDSHHGQRPGQFPADDHHRR
jgi:hypothetical protein